MKSPLAPLCHAFQKCEVFIAPARMQVGIIVFLWLLMLAPQLIVNPTFHADEVYYKGAGYHWVKDGSWTLPELQGIRPQSIWHERHPSKMTEFEKLPGLHPDMDVVYAAYPPGYTALYAAWTRVWGFGWRQGVMFDGVISLVLALLVWKICCVQIQKAGVLTLFAGFTMLVNGHSGRPDEAAMVAAAGMLLVLLWSHQKHPLGASLAAGISLGLCASISPPCAMIAALTGVAVVASSFGWRRAGVLLDLSVMTASSVCVFGLSWVPVYLYNNGALNQYLEMVRLATARGIVISLLEALVGWMRIWWVFVFLATGVFHACCRPGLARWCGLWAGSMLGVLALERTSAWQTYYAWFCAPYLLSNIFALLASPSRWSRGLAWFSAGIVALITIWTTVHRAWMLEDTFSRPELSMKVLEKYLSEKVPDGSSVFTNDAFVWYHLAGRCRVWDPSSTPTPLQRAQVTHVIWVGIKRDEFPWVKAMVPVWTREEMEAGRFDLVRPALEGSTLRTRNFAVFQHVNPSSPRL